jgi:hypothetical protein
MIDWGHLAEKYQETRPRKLLALDGGGIRGVLTLEVLAELERQLAAATAKDKEFRLGDYFDYIGGTSTGAIIAAGLALGKSVTELLDFYKQAGPAMFDKAFILSRVRNLYDARPLAKKLQETFGEKTDLTSKELRCLLLIVTRNVTTDSPWPVSSNPFARYNDTARTDCNLRIPLWQLVRASTAAPIYFAPEVLQWDAGDASKTFVFVDGGLTPYNNPAFLLYRMATQAAYNLNWKTGEKDLLLVSVGTGSAPRLDAEVYSSGKNLFSNLTELPSALMYGAQVDQDINCRMVGRCVHGTPIDRELGDMIPRDESNPPRPIPLSVDLGRSFLYARYNAELSHQGLQKMGLGDIDAAKVGQLDSVAHIDDLSRVGRKLAADVNVKEFGPFV